MHPQGIERHGRLIVEAETELRPGLADHEHGLRTVGTGENVLVMPPRLLEQFEITARIRQRGAVEDRVAEGEPIAEPAVSAFGLQRPTDPPTRQPRTVTCQTLRTRSDGHIGRHPPCRSAPGRNRPRG